MQRAKLDTAAVFLKAFGIPGSNEVLADPMVRLFLKSDGVTEDDLHRRHARPKAGALGESE